MRRLVWGVAILISPLLLLAGPGANAPAGDGATVKVSDKPPFGRYLTDSEGRSLYLFEADSKGNSNCYEACAKVWPPVTSAAKPEAGPNARADQLSTFQRKDGTTQVTYNGWPLYYFIKDKQAGDTFGQDVKGFGAEWYLVSPEGEKIDAKESKK